MAAVQPHDRSSRQAVPWALTIPRQHGAWSVLLLGFALGVGVAGRFGPGTLLVLASVVFAIPLRHVGAMWLRLPPSDGRRRSLQGWTLIYGLLAALPLLPLLLTYHRWLLVPLGAVACATGVAMTVLERMRLDRTLAGELVAMLGLCVCVPAAAYAGAGVLDATVLTAWLLAALVFCGGVLHVRHVVRSGKSAETSGPASRAGGVSVAFHALALIVAIGLGWFGATPKLLFLALVPATLRAIWPLLQPVGRRIPVRRLGFEELAYGVLFVLLAVLLLRR